MLVETKKLGMFFMLVKLEKLRFSSWVRSYKFCGK